jgi:beta-galactosidase
VEDAAGGTLELVARAPTSRLRAAPCRSIRRALPPCQPSRPRSLTEWRQAPASAQRPVPGQKLAEGDMNSWAWTKPGATQPSDPAARWVLLHVSFTPRRAVAAAGGTLRFASLAGRAEIWLDGARIAVKDDTPRPAAPPSRRAPGSASSTSCSTRSAALPSPPALGARFGIAGTVSLTPLR